MCDSTRTVVYGASDDLIEIGGHLSEEFGAYDSDPRYLAFANGVVLKITYDSEGVWRVQPRAGADRVEIVFARGEDEPRDADGVAGYSDKAVILNAGSWVVVGDSFHKAVAR